MVSKKVCKNFRNKASCFFSATITFTTVQTAQSATSGSKLTWNRPRQPSGHHGCFLHSIQGEGSKGAAWFSSVILKIITHVHEEEK